MHYFTVKCFFFYNFQDEQALSPPHPTEIQRRHSLAPPQTSSPPVISLTSEDTVDRKRRSSAQSLGPFSFSVSLFGDSRRSSLFSSDTRRSSERIRRPSTHSVGILPIASFGEGTEKPRKPSTHSLGILPLGWGEEYDGSPCRRPSVASLGPYWIHVRLDHSHNLRYNIPVFVLHFYVLIKHSISCPILVLTLLQNLLCFLLASIYLYILLSPFLQYLLCNHSDLYANLYSQLVNGRWVSKLLGDMFMYQFIWYT